MIWLLVLLSLFLSSCGFPDESQVVGAAVQLDSQLFSDVRSRVDVFGRECGDLRAGWTTQQKVYLGSKERVEAACGQAWSCNSWFRILIREDADIQWAYIHESLHSISYLAWGDWDYDHRRFGGGYYADTIKEILR